MWLFITILDWMAHIDDFHFTEFWNGLYNYYLKLVFLRTGLKPFGYSIHCSVNLTLCRTSGRALHLLVYFSRNFYFALYEIRYYVLYLKLVNAATVHLVIVNWSCTSMWLRSLRKLWSLIHIIFKFIYLKVIHIDKIRRANVIIDIHFAFCFSRYSHHWQ